MAKNAVFGEIKDLGWSVIQLTQKGYRGAIQTYKTSKGELVPVMFYLDECFIVEDKQGLFGVQDLKYGIMQEKSIDLEATGCINGLSLIAYLDENKKVVYSSDVLDRLNINTSDNREDIKKRLKAVNKLSEMVDVDMGYNE